MPNARSPNGLPRRQPDEQPDAPLPEDEIPVGPCTAAADGTAVTQTAATAADPVKREELHAREPSQATRADSPVLPTSEREPQSPLRRVSVLLGIAVVALLLWWGRPILLPVAVAVLLSFLLSPVCDWLERHHVPRALSVLAVVTGAFIVLGALGFAVFNGINQLGGNIDRISSNVAVKIDRMPFGNGQGTIGKVQETIENVEERLEERAAETVPEDSDGVNLATQPATGPAMAMGERDGPLPVARIAGATTQATTQPTTMAARGESAQAPVYVTPVPRELTPLERVGNFLAVIAGPLGAAGLVIIFTFFILFQRDDLRDRIITLTAGQQLNLATQALDDATTRISKYLLAQAIVNGTYGLAIGIGLELISLGIKGEHFPSVWLWALLCATLRFIPYLGPWVAAAFPIIVSIGWWPDYEVFLATAGYIIIIELLSNNVMEPLLYGSSTGMSPVAVIAAAVFWTFVWGPVGLLVATPLTTCLVVLGKYVPALRFFDILLGDEPVLPPHSRLYQRMLALDAEDAEDVARAYRKEHTLAETFDNVLLPALALAERDRHAGNLTPQRIDFVRETSREIVADLSSQSEPLPSDSVDLSEPPSGGTVPAASSARIVLLPSVDAADMTAAQMLKALLDRRGYEVLVVGEEELTSEKLESVFGQRADVAVISALPPRAVTRARYLVKRLRQAQAQRGEAASPIALLVGLWTMRYDARQAAERISEGGADIRVVTMLTEAVDEIRQRAEVATARRTSPPEPASPPMALASGPANISPAAR